LCEKYLKYNTMTVVSTKEFVTNQNKYFDLALNEQVIIQRGNNMFVVQHFVQNESQQKSRQEWAKAAKEFLESGNEESFSPDFFEDENNACR